jgi:hypothetical protein
MKKRKSGKASSAVLLRQVDAEAAAFSQPAFYRNLAAMSLGNVFYNRQSQTGSAHAAAAGLVHPVETLEQPRQMLLRNTDAMILDTDNHLRILSTGSQQNRTLRLTVFNGVIQQIGDRLLDEGGIQYGGRFLITIKLDADLFFFSLGPAQLNGRLKDVSDFYLLEVYFPAFVFLLDTR